MKIKELLLPLTLALATTWALQYFWGSRQDQRSEHHPSSGQKFEAPTIKHIPLHKPLHLEIDFFDAKSRRPTKLTNIETRDARYVFSNDGACLEQVSFFRNWGGQAGYLDTLPEIKEHDREQCTFLVALQAKTPYYFNLVEEQHDDRVHVLKYQADFEDGVLYKRFTIHNNIHRIDMQVTIEPKAGHEVQPRIFYGSPYLSEASAKDTITAINNDEHGSIQQHEFTDVAGHYWSHPKLFGTMDRYFLYSLIQDEQKFVQRGYYKLVGQHRLYSILEGPVIRGKKTWEVSFYVGPKTSKDMSAVDEHLEGVIRYGFFAPISKPISRFLLDILNFLYSYCGNYGFAIFFITLLLKLLMLPFTMRGEQAMSKSRKQRVQFEKKLKHLQKKYKEEPQTLAQARAELIKKHGIPGLGGLGGCLPILLQLPMFWGLSIILSQSIELYKASFLWIPDLSLPDPYYIFPILTGIGIMIHNPTGDPQQRLTSLVMGIFIAAFTINFSAGLTLYICIGTLLGVAQTHMLRMWKQV